ncbi:hypothetical protein ACFQDF_03905 [Ectobacillus funiculus]
MMKKGKWLMWAFITAAVFVIARLAFQHFNVFGGTGFHSQSMQPFQGNGFSQGGQFRGDEGFRGHGHMHGLWGMNILLEAGLFVAGWVIWKLAAGNRIRKWIGITLMALGAALILPTVLILPVILVAAYFAYKISRNDNASSAGYVQTEGAGFASLDSQKLDYLDEWEHKIHKEEK